MRLCGSRPGGLSKPPQRIPGHRRLSSPLPDRFQRRRIQRRRRSPSPRHAHRVGPAAGVTASVALGNVLGLKQLISFDMGGTTAKASLINNGEVSVTTEYEVGGSGNVRRWLQGTGYPIKVPVVDLAEVSAGGGSIAWLDDAGGLRVGPQSAGAAPGPACYGLGGQDPTVTDADAVLGYLDPGHFLGGRMPLSIDGASTAINRVVGEPLGLDLMQAAQGIVDIVNSNMADAIRMISIERGHDPPGLLPHCLRRRRARSRWPHRRRAGHQKGHHPSQPRRLFRHGSRVHGPERDYVRSLYTLLDAAGVMTGCAKCIGILPPRPGTCSRGPVFLRKTGFSVITSTFATATRPTNLRYPSRPRRSMKAP